MESEKCGVALNFPDLILSRLVLSGHSETKWWRNRAGFDRFSFLGPYHIGKGL